MKIEEVIINGERIFLKKKSSRYRIVYPCKIDGKINWKNLIAGGNWFNLIKVAVIVLFILGCTWEYSNAVRIAQECINSNPFYILP